MKLVRSIFAHDRGSSTVDFAFALPAVIIIMLGTLQLGIYLQAAGTLRHALGEGIRFAKVDPDATQAEVLAEVKDEMPSMDPDQITKLTFERGTTNGADYGKIAISYKLEPIVPLVPIPPITITEEKTAYLPS